MCYILNIETATKNCSVSVSHFGDVCALVETNDAHYSHAENLHVFIEKVLAELKITFKELSAIAVSKGPGSYTGLRIGISAAKGLAYALNIPLIGIDTLLMLAKKITPKPNTLIVPMLDARRMEVYTAVFDANFNVLEHPKALILTPDAFQNYNQKIVLLGDCMEKVQSIFKGSQFEFAVSEKFPSAKEMAAMGYQLFQEKKFEDVAYFEPFYLKDFFLG